MRLKWLEKGKKGRENKEKKGRRAFNSTVRSVAPSFSRDTVTQVFGLRYSYEELSVWPVDRQNLRERSSESIRPRVAVLLRFS